MAGSGLPIIPAEDLGDAAEKVVAAVKEEVTALVLPSTPPVLSIGKRCETMGYSFHWPAWSRRPYFETPGGEILTMRTRHHVPYISTESTAAAAPDQRSDTARTGLAETPTVGKKTDVQSCRESATIHVDSDDDNSIPVASLPCPT